MIKKECEVRVLRNLRTVHSLKSVYCIIIHIYFNLLKCYKATGNVME